MSLTRSSTILDGMTDSTTKRLLSSQARKTSGPLVSIVARAETFANAGMLRGKNWSLSQICHHLALVIENTVRASAADEPPKRWRQLNTFQRLMRWGIKRVMLISGWFPRGAPAPRSVCPPEGVPLEAALSHLRTAAESFDKKCARSDVSWGYHSLLGRMSGRAWRRFHHIHSAHHFSFLREAGP